MAAVPKVGVYEAEPVSAPRLDAVAKVTGRMVYGSDLEVPGMLWAAVLRSPYAHARLLKVDASRAAAMAGVHAVLTRDDFVGKPAHYGPALRDQPVVALDRVRYAGEIVAAVAADDLETAKAALELIDVEYEPLPVVADVDAALDPQAPILHEALRPAGSFGDLSEVGGERQATNVCHRWQYERGDVEAGFAQADYIFEDVFTLPPIHHYSLEPYVAIGQVDHEGITVWTTTQHPFPVRRDLAHLFGEPIQRVRIIVPGIGGAFGGKCYTKIEPIVVALSAKARRPVKLVLAVEESFRTITRHGAKIRIKTGVKKDGTLVAREADVYMDTGAYADIGPRVAVRAGFRIIGAYRIDNLRIRSYAVYTNKVPAGAYRGYGTPQVAWALESQLDIIADALGLDPLEFRLKNLLSKGEEYVEGNTPLDGDLQGSLRAVAEAIGWGRDDTGRTAGDGRAGSGAYGAAMPRAKGLACAVKDGGGPATVTVAMVRMHADASVTVLVGSVEIGQGVRTVLAQVVARELGLPLSSVIVAPLDTANVPYDWGTSASRGLVLSGTAVHAAARDVARQLRQMAADVAGVDPEAVELRDGRATAGDWSMPLAELIARHHGMPGGEIIGRGTVRPEKRPGLPEIAYWEVGMSGVSLAVDEETGLLHLESVISLADAGVAINRLMAEGQDEGAAMQGLGHALFEEMVYEDGMLVNGTLVDYRVPTFADLPPRFETILVENRDGSGPFGSKGIGESGIVGISPAIANALYRATGVRLRDLPLTPEKVWRALRSARSARSS